MRSIEVHLLETARDIDTALQAGLLEVTDLDATECGVCGESVGNVLGEFISFTVSLDETDEPWFTCAGCAAPVIDPSAAGTTSYEGLFDSQEEFEEFTLFDDE